MNFNEIRMSLIEPPWDAPKERKEIARNAAGFKGIFGLSEVLGGTVAVVTLVATLSIPYYAFVAIPSFLLALASHEARVISQNVEELFDAHLIV